MAATRGLLAAVLSISFSALAGPVTVDFVCRDEAPGVVRGTASLRSVADPSVTRSQPLTGNRVTFSEAAGTDWELSVIANGFWAPAERLTFAASDAERQQTVRLWRTGRVRASIQAPVKPTAVRLAVTSPPNPRRLPEIPGGLSFDCFHGKGNEWTCEVPATTLDLAIRSEGYAPHYIWNAKVPAAGTVSVGEVTLQKGGALLAWLDAEALKDLDRPVKAILRRESLPAATATAVRVSEPVAESIFSSKGVTHLSPIPAGRYILETRADGYVPTQINVEIFEGKESALRHLIELYPAVTVRLRIEPALAPDGAPWQIELWRRVTYGSGSEAACSGAASPEGVFEARDQAEGPIRVVVRDGKRNMFASRELNIGPGGGDLSLTLNPVRLPGIVKIGGEVLPRAVLLFGGAGGAEKVRVTGDDEGRFEVTLPRTGEWPVDVTAAAEAVATTANVEIAEGDDSIVIDLPNNEISGWVRDSVGQRLANARVEVISGRGAQTRATDSNGVFRFRGLPAGSFSVRATDPGTREYSAESRVTVSEGGKIENLELSIESLRSFHGLVRSGGVAVPGARLSAYAPLGNTAQQERATTDLQGRFELDIPLAAPKVILVVGVAGRTLHPFTVVPTQEGVVVDVAPQGGELRLRWPAGTRPIRITFNDGTPLPMPELMDWARANGTPAESRGITVPNVAPGSYEVCTGAICTVGTLAIGGSLELDLTPLLPAPAPKQP